MIFTRRQGKIWALAAFAVLGVSTAPAHDIKHDALHPARPGAIQSEPFGQPGMPENVARTIPVTLSDSMRFIPDKLTIKRGETIRLHISNAGKIPHEFVLGTRQELAEHATMMRQMPGMTHSDANAVQVAPGKSADIVWQFSKPGNFLFACLIPGHRESGMEGSVAVTVTKPRRR